MTLEQLQTRQQELHTALTQTSQQVYMLQGHKQEIDYQIGLKLKEAELIEDETVDPDAIPPID